MAELRHSDGKAGQFVVGNLSALRKLNDVYRYFLHQNPEICVKHIAPRPSGRPRAMRITQKSGFVRKKLHLKCATYLLELGVGLISR